MQAQAYQACPRWCFWDRQGFLACWIQDSKIGPVGSKNADIRSLLSLLWYSMCPSAWVLDSEHTSVWQAQSWLLICTIQIIETVIPSTQWCPGFASYMDMLPWDSLQGFTESAEGQFTLVLQENVHWFAKLSELTAQTPPLWIQAPQMQLVAAMKGSI